ncbi:IS903D transposase [Klebsiella variicola]|nr:IS903D transposase [Klebsiella variicola]
MIKSLAPEGMLAAVFEDDGRTGYFYALDESVEGNPIAPVVERLNGIEAHLDQERAVHGVRLENESMVTPVFATPILTTSWLA